MVSCWTRYISVIAEGTEGEISLMWIPAINDLRDKMIMLHMMFIHILNPNKKAH